MAAKTLFLGCWCGGSNYRAVVTREERWPDTDELLCIQYDAGTYNRPVLAHAAAATAAHLLKLRAGPSLWSSLNSIKQVGIMLRRLCMLDPSM